MCWLRSIVRSRSSPDIAKPTVKRVATTSYDRGPTQYGKVLAESYGANQVDVLRKRARRRRDNALMPTRRRHMDLRGR
jgi:hypothetical protein